MNLAVPRGLEPPTFGLGSRCDLAKHGQTWHEPPCKSLDFMRHHRCTGQGWPTRNIAAIFPSCSQETQ